MERCLLVAQCVRQLDPSNTTNQDQPSVLGLTPQLVMELMPSEKVNHKFSTCKLKSVWDVLHLFSVNP